MSFCLPKFAADKFRTALKDGTIEPAKLASMSSDERHAFFSKLLGESHAKPTNALFESKLLLKDQQAGIIRWAKSLSGISPQVRNDLIDRVSKLDKLLNPNEEEAFLKDFAAQKMGFEVSSEEAKHISDLAVQAQQTKSLAERVTSAPDWSPLTETPEQFSERTAYGSANIAFHDYVESLKLEAKGNVFKQAGLNPVAYASKLGGIVKALKATGDLSFLLRQGGKVFWDHPLVWSRGARTALETFGKQLFKPATSNEVLDAVKAEIVSRKNALNGNYQKMKLAIGTTEENFPTSLPERVPGLGRAFKASEVAYNAPAYVMRADLADQMISLAEKSGKDIDSKMLKAMGEFINTSTGRSGLGVVEPVAGAVNNLLFSPRFFVSNVKQLTQVFTGAGGGSFVRRQAAERLTKAILGTAAILKLSDTINPGSVEWDPRSSDFGKIKIGDTRFDVTFGTASVITLAARLALQESKSSVTGKVTKLDEFKKGKPVFGGPTTEGVIGDFALNKIAPILSTALALRKGFDTHTGNPTNLTSVDGATNLAKNAFEPLPASNVEEVINDPNAAPLIAAMIADAFGISTNTYGK